MSVPGDSVRFIVRLTGEGLVSFRRDRGCGRAAMLAICRAIVGGSASVRDVTPVAVDELSASRTAANEYWREDLLLRFSARQRVGGVIEVERDCGSSWRTVVDLCESLLDSSYDGELDELDDTHYHRHIKRAG